MGFFFTLCFSINKRSICRWCVYNLLYSKEAYMDLWNRFADKLKTKYHVNCPCSQYPGQLPPSFICDNHDCESGSV